MRDPRQVVEARCQTLPRKDEPILHAALRQMVSTLLSRTRSPAHHPHLQRLIQGNRHDQPPSFADNYTRAPGVTAAPPTPSSPPQDTAPPTQSAPRKGNPRSGAKRCLAFRTGFQSSIPCPGRTFFLDKWRLATLGLRCRRPGDRHRGMYQRRGCLISTSWPRVCRSESAGPYCGGVLPSLLPFLACVGGGFFFGRSAPGSHPTVALAQGSRVPPAGPIGWRVGGGGGAWRCSAGVARLPGVPSLPGLLHARPPGSAGGGVALPGSTGRPL